MHITNLGLHQVSFQSGDSYKGAEETGKHKGVSVISYQIVKNGERKFDYVNRLKFLNLLIEYIIYQIHFTSPQS
ncbi:hypothetical protein GLN30_24315, partial [Shigella flexneri]|uniref:inositol phosphate phosphatase SopB n=1 Tax=Shigella flexneri TaxID=623 RepID=UPI001394A654